MLRRTVAVVTIAAGSAFGIAGSATAGPGPAVPHCVTPSGIDLNEVIPSAQPIVAFFCTTIPARAPWRAFSAWFTAPTHEVIPAGYVPKKATPIDDFAAKFVKTRFVIDRGTVRERTLTFDVKNLRTRRPPDGFGWVSDPLRALGEGSHTVDIHVFLSADHWDGIDDDPAANLLPAGWTLFEHITFTAE